MSCNCVEEVEKKLREGTGDPDARMVIIYSSGKRGTTEYIPIPVIYREKKKDGSFGRPLKRNITGAYCPICGKKVSGTRKEAEREKGN